ncbi:MAG: thiamine pyrophosphate-dependent enzyme, partial [Gemmatimonadales bacterium]
IKWKQEDMGFPSYGLDYGNPDFVRYAESYGAQGHRVGRAGELAPLLGRCLDTPGVHVVDLAVDYADNDRVLNREIKELSRAL